MYARIASVVDPSKIDYIISNHAEMDHSGALPEVIRELNPEKVFASVAGVKALHDHFRIGDKLTPVKTGDSISLGNLNLSFVETKMLHWPDSMFTYLVEDKLLFSQDGFGMHLATNQLFVDENEWDVIETEMKRYYANILLPYAPQALKLLEVFPTLNLDIAMIAPDHGPLWRGDLLTKPLELYGKWAKQEPVDQALVVYDTMWHSTEKMAFEIADGLRSTGAKVKVMALDGHSRSDIAAEMLDVGALVVGSPTINNGLFPRTADVLTYLKGLRPKNLIGAAFGSFGWSGEAVAQINDYLKAMNVELVSDGLKLKYVPAEAELAQAYELGKLIGEKLLEKVQK
jgi:flavorubredoxin